MGLDRRSATPVEENAWPVVVVGRVVGRWVGRSAGCAAESGIGSNKRDGRPTTGRTLAAASSLDKDIKAAAKNGATAEAAASVGKLVAERGLASRVEEVIFDRGSYLYHGRVTALAETAREAVLDV